MVGGGNSGAQIDAALHAVVTVRRVTQLPACFLPDSIDGRTPFEIATRHVRGEGPRISET